MSYTPLNNVTTQDRYTDANTIRCPGAERINLDVGNAAIYYQLGDGRTTAVEWRPEVFLSPKFLSLDRHADAVRVRSAVAGVPAQVTAEGIPGSEVPG